MKMQFVCLISNSWHDACRSMMCANWEEQHRAFLSGSGLLEGGDEQMGMNNSNAEPGLQSESFASVVEEGLQQLNVGVEKQLPMAFQMHRSEGCAYTSFIPSCPVAVREASLPSGQRWR